MPTTTTADDPGSGGNSDPKPPATPRSSTGLLQRTGASESYFRRHVTSGGGTAAAAAPPPASATTPGTSTSAPVAYRRSLSDPVQPEEMKDRSNMNAATNNTIRAGSLRPPGELGVHHPPRSDSIANTSSTNDITAPHPNTVRRALRVDAAVQRARALEAHRAIVAAAAAAPTQPQHKKDATTTTTTTTTTQQPPPQQEPACCCLVASFCFDGMEVVIATTAHAAYVLHARTHLVYQRLRLQLDDANSDPTTTAATTTTSSTTNNTNSSSNTTSTILVVQSHAANGLVCVALSSGLVQTFHPVPTDPTKVCAGRYRWVPGPCMDCALCFYDASSTPTFSNHNSGKNGCRREVGDDDDEEEGQEQSLDLALSGDGKVLVAHRDQLAVFDGAPSSSASALATAASACSGKGATTTAGSQQLEKAALLWTTQLPGLVKYAKISGDGQSIAVVLKQRLPSDDTDDEDDLKAATDGIHTFTRDSEDGSSLDLSSIPQPPQQQRLQSASSSRLQRPTLDRHWSMGILYKPGPFLVHSGPVTRLSFRGYGHVTSDCVVQVAQGNDLLLTYCASDSSARIFGQNNWNPLTEWTTPANTRVEWVKGISAFTLGDLESFKSPKKNKKSTSGPPFSSAAGAAGDTGDNDIHESLGKRLHFSSIPNHPAPSTNAGAWVVEISFQDVYPALRLSRLTYLKRGVDDLNPTLLESVSSFLPVDCVFRDRILTSDESGLSIEGVWPAWNPWLSESTELSTTDTLSGSAMAFLGLSSGPSAGVVTGGGGYFGGDARLGGAQSPPSELRIVSSHAVAGQFVISEISMLGDKAMTSLELGNPKRTILSVSHLSDCALVAAPNGQSSTLQSHNRIPRTMKASMPYGSSRLTAELLEGARSLAITWRRPGTMSFLPQNWLADDVDPGRAAALLKNSASTLRDESLIPPPVVLPSLHLLSTDADNENVSELIYAVRWWPDSKSGGAPLLVAVTTCGKIVVFEVAPPSTTLEPPMPDYGKPPPTPIAVDMNGMTPSQSFDSLDDTDYVGREYEVAITPDPEYGLGLRLESQVNGMCAIAGSYKRHPLNGETLPSEKVGKIRLGDELLSANGVDLENKSFDEIIATVREVGSSCGPGNPIRMKFRRLTPAVPPAVTVSHRRNRSFGSDSSLKRRTIETMIGVSPEEVGRKRALRRSRSGESKKESNIASTSMRSTQSKLATAKQTSIVGMFSDSLHISSDASAAHDAESTFALIPYESAAGDDVAFDDSPRTALLFWAEGTSVVVKLLSIATESDHSKADCFDLGEYSTRDDATAHSAEACVCAMHVITSGYNAFNVATCSQVGQVRLMTVLLEGSGDPREWSLTFKSFSIFHLKRPWSSGCVLRAYSADLLATMQPEDDGTCNTISVWSASPQPGCALGGASDDNDDVGAAYFPTEVSTEFYAGGNTFLDFYFLRSGFLDASPSLITFSLKGAAMCQKQGGSSDWMPAAQIAYSAMTWSDGASPLATHSRSFLQINDQPEDMFPHLVPGLCSSYTSSDEKVFLRSDWHPDAQLAHICTSELGVKSALKSRVRSMFIWLCEEGKYIPEGFLDCSLAVAPIPIVDAPSSDVEESPGNLMTAFTARAPRESPETTALRDLQSVLLSYLSRFNAVVERMDIRTVEEAPAEMNGVMDLPQVLRSMGIDELRLLWALGEVAIDQPRFDSIDAPGQLFLFSSALFQKIISVSDDKHKCAKGFMPEHGTMVRKSHVKDMAVNRAPATIASAGAMAALLSSDQVKLLERCRTPNQKMTWEFARERRIIFWERSDAALARLSEEIGQTIFRETRDIMECALFFIIARKLRTLRNLAATASDDSGRMFFKFITKHDFSSERGRQAAEKNAFSLLRKCRYRAAAAFFLLATPPFLKSAVETIATKMKDIDLAFLVARLTESAELDAAASFTASGFGGVLGGGGGYAASTIAQDTDSPSCAEDRFSDWKPRLGKETIKLIVDRILPKTVDDNVMSGVSLLWLGKNEEAAWFLAGNVDARHAGITRYNVVNDVPYCFFESLPKIRRSIGSGGLSYQAIDNANAFIDFTSACSLLEALNAGSRVRLAASMQVAQALSARGVDISSLNVLLRPDVQPGFKVTENVVVPAAFGNADAALQSSIFDNFAPPPSSQTASQAPAIQSSIFDGFDAPTPTRKPTPPAAPQSSIFDGFDAAPPSRKTTSSTMQSSIFDDFDAPPPVKRPPPESGTMQSSIFDDFDAPPPVKKPPTASGTVQSSIFDSFDATPVKRSNPQDNDGVQSSIFDGFDGPLRAQKGDAVADKAPQTPTNGSTSASAVQSNETDDDSHFLKTQLDLGIETLPSPELWDEWRHGFLLAAAAKRLLREIATVLAEFDGDPADIPVHELYRFSEVLVTPGSSEVLQLPCEADRVLGRVRQAIDGLCALGELDSRSLISGAIRLLGSYHNHRMLFSVVLYVAIGRSDLAEDVVRLCANTLIEKCNFFTISYDELIHKKRTRSHVASYFIRREAIRLTWQLESCLWLHRGGGLPLSGIALNESTVAVRIGLLLASWNRNFECLEAIIQNEPDCLIDEDTGRQLWTSMKVIDSSKADLSSKKTTSGGWEFLVDCKRSQATELLKERSTGCFIIRPHTDDHGVFSLSFKTNLVPEAAPEANGREREFQTPETSGDELSDADVATKPPRPIKKKVRKDDVVQHAIVRLSDSGFRCGSFGPFTSLISLLEAVSSSLPFNLRFDLPPRNRVIKEEGSQTSPNAVLLRKLNLRRADSLASHPSSTDGPSYRNGSVYGENGGACSRAIASRDEQLGSFGLFAHLLVLCLVRRQLSSVVSVAYDDYIDDDEEKSDSVNQDGSSGTDSPIDALDDKSSSQFVVSSRILSPLLTWCRSIEIAAVTKLSPEIRRVAKSAPTIQESFTETSDSVTESPDAIEVSPVRLRKLVEGGDSILRGMVQQESGVGFSTLRLVDGGECTMLILFNKTEALRWLISNGIEQCEETAIARLDKVERDRVIEQLDLSLLPLKQKNVDPEDEGVRYRFVDPWEVEALSNREGETKSACLGRGRFVGFSLGKVALSTENIFRELGGVPLLELWASSKGGIALTKALASVHPAWERSASGDLKLKNGTVTEPPPFVNSIRRCLYRNALYRRLELPQRFLSLVQVELLDLKNLTSPGGSLSLTAYALLRLKRAGSSGTLTNKARTLDSAATPPSKLNKTSGPNAPASWGAVVRFRFPLPEDVSVDGTSFDRDRESLFKGPPRVLQVSVYEKKLLVDHALGTADISLDGLGAGGQLEEWVPLRSEKTGITWFARIRLTLRFELMCMAPESQMNSDLVPSVGLERIKVLCQGGSAHEDTQKRSMSSPDLLSYFEGIVY